MSHTPQSILKDIFGYKEFRQYQREVIDSVLQKKDTLVVMPTGGGKSICYQIPAMIFPGLTVVISPLISLMKDQVNQLNQVGIPAVVLNSSIPNREYAKNMQQVEKGTAKLLYVAPETLLLPRTQKLLQHVNLDCITVDEAHCISEWGHDFRPEYRQIAEVRQHFPQAACIALTATATPRVQSDIKNSLNFPAGNEYIASFDRKNLLLQVVDKINAMQQTLDFLKKHQGEAGIIYCFSRNQVDDTAAILQDRGFSALPYHAGMDASDRTDTQEKFIRDDVDIIVATVAFGMGINKSNVRFVVHYDLPKNIESYYQEIGRAGRDDLPAECLLFLGFGDIRKIRFFFKEKSEKERQIAEAQLQALLRYAEFDGCRRKPLLKYFGQEYSKSDCGMCDNCCSDQKDLQDLTIQAQKFLSCVIRTGEIFGANYIADVLRGSKNRRILNFRHNRLSTYDIGGELTKKQWGLLSNQLVRQGFLLRSEEVNGGLRLAEKALHLLRGEEKFQAEMVEDNQAPRTSIREVDISNYDRELFDELRKYRKRLAEQANLPPYVIFSDKSLVDMASCYPQSEEAFLMIHGVGEEKNKRYSQGFRQIIQRYCKSKGIEEKSTGHRRLTAQRRHKKPLKYMVTGEAFNEGKSIDQLAAQDNIQTQTVISHLVRYVREGNTLRHHNFRKDYPELDNMNESIAKAFEKHGDLRLGPVFAELKGSISYELLNVFLLQQIVDAQESA
ncbi:MAG: DNA helicase RecQ [Calditrichaeota bacterium]|nr:MAG: DNA helicase RecQ [Calditrichota bacterium]